jgi:AcrR family transcriptional regulator
MPAEIREKRPGEVTRQRILEAALARFAQASYEEVRLRDIAADVGVDVALVHRSFGSKEQLFAEVFKAAVQSERLLACEKTDLIAVFTKDIFERDSDPTSGHAEALQIFVHSLSSPQAREALRAFASRDFIGTLAAKLDDRALQRATLFVACLTGISILRDVLRVEPLLDESREESQPLIERILGVCLDDSREANPSTAATVSVEPTTRKTRAKS